MIWTLDTGHLSINCFIIHIKNHNKHEKQHSTDSISYSSPLTDAEYGIFVIFLSQFDQNQIVKKNTVKEREREKEKR